VTIVPWKVAGTATVAKQIAVPVTAEMRRHLRLR
jgi:hypothetical protein